MKNNEELNVEEMEQVNGGLFTPSVETLECTETAKLKATADDYCVWPPSL